MPKFLESILRREAAKKGFTGKRADQYVYGTMNARGYMKGPKETAKGAQLEAKHKRGVGKTSNSPQRHPTRNLGSRAHGRYDWQ